MNRVTEYCRSRGVGRWLKFHLRDVLRSCPPSSDSFVLMIRIKLINVVAMSSWYNFQTIERPGKYSDYAGVMSKSPSYQTYGYPSMALYAVHALIVLPRSHFIPLMGRRLSEMRASQILYTGIQRKPIFSLLYTIFPLPGSSGWQNSPTRTTQLKTRLDAAVAMRVYSISAGRTLH